MYRFTVAMLKLYGTACEGCNHKSNASRQSLDGVNESGAAATGSRAGRRRHAARPAIMVGVRERGPPATAPINPRLP
jgi:hypothetical protein